jgi:hypothetical protein
MLVANFYDCIKVLTISQKFFTMAGHRVLSGTGPPTSQVIDRLIVQQASTCSEPQKWETGSTTLPAFYNHSICPGKYQIVFFIPVASLRQARQGFS